MRKPIEFIEHLDIEYGPQELLGRFFLKADTALKERGVTLTMGTFEELKAVNQANKHEWHALFPTFDPEINELNESNAFCLLGRDAQGEIVCTQAGRVFDWHSTNFFDEVASLRLLYDDVEASKRPDESVNVTAEGARELTGIVSFTGSQWLRRDKRGMALPVLLARVARSYCYTRWNTDLNTAMMAKGVVEGRQSVRTGHPSIDWSVDLKGSVMGDVQFAVLWMNMHELRVDLEDFLANFETRMDRRIYYRRAQE